VFTTTDHANDVIAAIEFIVGGKTRFDIATLDGIRYACYHNQGYYVNIEA
jgi:hypothetical protein